MSQEAREIRRMNAWFGPGRMLSYSLERYRFIGIGVRDRELMEGNSTRSVGSEKRLELSNQSN